MPAPASYWKQRKEHEKREKALRAIRDESDFWRRVSNNAVATVLPGQVIPACLASYPVFIKNANGSQTVCKHLV